MQLVTPYQDSVLVRLSKECQEQKSGLILTARTVKEVNAGKGAKPFKGTVVAVGSGFVMPHGESRPIEVQEGDMVVFAYHEGLDHIQHNGEDVVMVKEHALQVVL